MLKGCVILYRACFENGKEFVALRLRRPVTQLKECKRRGTHQVSGDILVRDLGGTTFQHIFNDSSSGIRCAEREARCFSVKNRVANFTEYWRQQNV